MSYYTNTAGRRLWMPEPSLEPPEEDSPHYCERCECLLDDGDPRPLCWVCAREED